MLATVQVPERDGPIIPTAGQHAPIGTHLERLDCPLMRLAHLHARPAVDLPPAQHAVTVSTDQPLPTRSPDHRRDHPRMPRKGSIPCITSPPERVPGRAALPALHLPHPQLPAISLPLAAAARGQSRAIGAPSHT